MNEILLEALKEIRSMRVFSPQSKIYKIADEAIKKFEDSSGKETGMKWMKEKPEKECVFITRTKYVRNDEPIEYDYSVWQIKKLDGEDDNGGYAWYLGLLNGDGEEWGPLEDLGADEYFIIDESVPPYKEEGTAKEFLVSDFLRGATDDEWEEIENLWATCATSNEFVRKMKEKSTHPYKEEEKKLELPDDIHWAYKEEVGRDGVAQVWELAEEMVARNRSWRVGQCLFNALYELYPKIADEIRGQEYDPFYKDDRIFIFTNKIRKALTTTDGEQKDLESKEEAGMKEDEDIYDAVRQYRKEHPQSDQDPTTNAQT